MKYDAYGRLTSRTTRVLSHDQRRARIHATDRVSRRISRQRHPATTSTTTQRPRAVA